MEKHLAIVKTPFELGGNFQLTQKKMKTCLVSTKCFFT